MKPPSLTIPLSLTPSEASVLLHLIEDAAERHVRGLTFERLKTLRAKLNVALYAENRHDGR